MTVRRCRVLDAGGAELAPCEAARARQLLAAGRATPVEGEEMTIRLPYAVLRPAARVRHEGAQIAPGTPLLLHICCGPCATYPVPRLRELGFDVAGWWYNPNIQPAEEHTRREEAARALAGRLGLPLAAGAYEMERYEAAVRGDEARPERCRRCYRLRLEATAAEAERRGIGAFTTTLLISPYQDQAALREIGDEVAAAHGLHFFFENLRRGWAQRGRLAREYGLYMQQYCGCRFSLAERIERRQPAGKER
ncbi:MAG TPA: epoxyqueuosine reductase QueH [Anaerolineae bacterium]|nr:epoxyqueuosine reductase QueH [Anaerolineae bacterium]HOQ97235.1 epoxyqueuosine reductase QueH [Anaerolineae bacterium]HPL26460.1 epoxyqueuosine reductase QueH [Anaerolineae bacterium]